MKMKFAGSRKYDAGKYRIKAALIAGVLCMSVMTGNLSVTPVYAEEFSEEELAEMMGGTFRPSDVTFPRQEKYEYPFLGLNAVLPESLMEKMDSKEVAMLCNEDWTDDYKAVKYAYLSWSVMTEEQRDAEVDKLGDGYLDWVGSLERIGTLGMYQEDQAEKLDELTGCTEHKELGESADGNYKYYLSINPEADKELTDEVKEIRTEFTEMTPFQDTSVFDQPYEENGDVDHVGKFETQDVQGETYTEELFQDHDLTMVNIFTTWCSPCINEIPDLEKLHQEMSDKGVGVVGVVLDSVDGNGEAYAEALEKAKLIAEKTGASYPFLIPDSTNMNGRLNGINAVPETFFVDKDGNIVGETYSGSRSLEDWKTIVEKELADLKGEE